ncbi:MAG: P-II family nitrogen regulator [Candidatus Nitrosocaldaceae archaeon]
MKSVEAIIRVEKAIEVRTALINKGYSAMSISTVIGRGEQKEREYSMALGIEVTYDLFARTYIMLIVDDEKVDEVVDIIQKSATTNSRGDGIIFVRPIEKAIRIRNGEKL